MTADISAIFPIRLHWERKPKKQSSINLVFCSPSENTFKIQVIKNSRNHVTCYCTVSSLSRTEVATNAQVALLTDIAAAGESGASTFKNIRYGQ